MIFSAFVRLSKEIREGGRQLLDKLQKYRPLIAAFNGKGKIHHLSPPSVIIKSHGHSTWTCVYVSRHL